MTRVHKFINMHLGYLMMQLQKKRDNLAVQFKGMSFIQDAKIPLNDDFCLIQGG